MQLNEALEFAERIQPTLELMNSVGFADMKIPAPSICIYPDEANYFDSQKMQIHLGAKGIYDIFSPEDEEEYFSAINYIRGHEEQHCRSTASEPYQFAIRQAVKTFVEYVQLKEDGKKKLFRRWTDYQKYIKSLEDRGCYINWNAIFDYAANLANSLEDGRIERLRSNRFPGFAALRRFFRGRFWFATDTSHYKPYDEIKDNAVEKLTVVSAELLTLATCNLYTGGFDIYEETPMEDFVNDLKPDIAKAVMSGRTRGLIDPMVNIMNKVSPLLYEAFKLSEKDIEMQKMFEQMLQDMLKTLIESGIGSLGALSEGDEDTDDGSANSVFGHSDLVIVLSDEEYDKMIEKHKESDESKSGAGVMIQREHPKEDADGENASQNPSQGASQNSSQDSSSSSQDSSQNPTTEQGQSTEQGRGKDEGEEMPEGSNGSSASDQSETDEKEGTSEGKNQTKNGKKDGEQKQSGKNDQKGTEGQDSDASKDSNNLAPSKNLPKPSSTTDQMGQMKNQREQKHVDKNMQDQIREEIRKAMKEAAKVARVEAETNIDSANRINASVRKNAISKRKSVVSKAITAEDMKDICSFTEMRREYQLTEKLPMVYQQRGKTIHRKNEQYFKSLSTPNVTYLNSGSIDPSRIYGLAMGDTEIFRKKGIDKQFDGCAYILIDNSGSMAGEKRTEACKAAAIIEEGFRDILPFKIVAFDYSGVVIHEVVKDWEENPGKNCCWNFCKLGRTGCSNEDGFDIQIAERELLARPEKKKLLLVLSDGTPGDPAYCQRAIAHARKSGIKVHGIYFETADCVSNEQFADMYQKDYVCCPLSELDMNVQKIMKAFSRS